MSEASDFVHSNELVHLERQMERSLETIKHSGVEALLKALYKKNFVRKSLKIELIQLEALFSRLRDGYNKLRKITSPDEREGVEFQLSSIETKIEDLERRILERIRDVDKILGSMKGRIDEVLREDGSLVNLFATSYGNRFPVSTDIRKLYFRLQARLHQEVQPLFELLSQHCIKLENDIKELINEQKHKAINGDEVSLKNVISKLEFNLRAMDNIIKDADQFGRAVDYDLEDNKSLIYVTEKLIEELLSSN